MSGPEFDEFFPLMEALDANQVEYVLVGGMAVNLHGLIRATEDIDLFVKPETENIKRLKAALRVVWDDPHIEEISAEDLMGDYPVVRYGPPATTLVLDIIGRLGEAFCYGDLECMIVSVRGVPVRLATPATLYRMTKNIVRPQDRADAYVLAQKFELED